MIVMMGSSDSERVSALPTIAVLDTAVPTVTPSETDLPTATDEPTLTPRPSRTPRPTDTPEPTNTATLTATVTASATIADTPDAVAALSDDELLAQEIELIQGVTAVGLISTQFDIFYAEIDVQQGFNNVNVAESVYQFVDGESFIDFTVILNDGTMARSYWWFEAEWEILEIGNINATNTAFFENMVATAAAESASAQSFTPIPTDEDLLDVVRSVFGITSPKSLIVDWELNSFYVEAGIITGNQTEEYAQRVYDAVSEVHQFTYFTVKLSDSLHPKSFTRDGDGWLVADSAPRIPQLSEFEEQQVSLNSNTKVYACPSFNCLVLGILDQGDSVDAYGLVYGDLIEFEGKWLVIDWDESKFYIHSDFVESYDE